MIDTPGCWHEPYVVQQNYTIGAIHKLRKQDFPNFDPPLLRKELYYINLWLTPLPLACLRGLWMPPY